MVNGDDEVNFAPAPSTPNGLRNTTYYRLTFSEQFAMFRWPSWLNPHWNDEREAELLEFYGGRDTSGWQHEVATQARQVAREYEFRPQQRIDLIPLEGGRARGAALRMQAGQGLTLEIVAEVVKGHGARFQPGLRRACRAQCVRPAKALGGFLQNGIVYGESFALGPGLCGQRLLNTQARRFQPAPVLGGRYDMCRGETSAVAMEQGRFRHPSRHQENGGSTMRGRQLPLAPGLRTNHPGGVLDARCTLPPVWR